MTDDASKTLVLRRKDPYGRWTYLNENGQWCHERSEAFRTGNRRLLAAMQERLAGTNRGEIVRLI